MFSLLEFLCLRVQASFQKAATLLATNNKTRNETSRIEIGILKAGSECNTFAIGNAAKYAARKITTNIMPTLWRANRN